MLHVMKFRNSPHHRKSKCIQSHRLAGHAKVQCLAGSGHSRRSAGDAIRTLGGFTIGLSGAEDHGSDAVWVTKAHQANAIDEVQSGISSFALRHDRFHGREDSLLHVEAVLLFRSQRLGQGFGENVEQEFGIRVCVDVSLQIRGMC